MIPLEHRQETYQRAFVTAIAADAGIRVELSSSSEYGLDGTFHTVTEVTSATGSIVRFETGFPVDFQMKSTTNCRDLKNAPQEVSYDCKADAYNKLILRSKSGFVPLILLVLCMPRDEHDWLRVSAQSLTLNMACYWQRVTGLQTGRTSRVIRLPRGHLFTPDALKDIMIIAETNGGNL